MHGTAGRKVTMDSAPSFRQDGGVEICRHRFTYDGPLHVKKNELQPNRSVYWKMPPDGNAAFVAAMEDVLDVYARPYDPEFGLTEFPAVFDKISFHFRRRGKSVLRCRRIKPPL